MTYNFVWSTQEIDKFQRIFFSEATSTHDIITKLLYRHSKISQEDLRSGSWPTGSFVHQFSHCVDDTPLSDVISHTYHRVEGAFNPCSTTVPPIPARMFGVYVNAYTFNAEQGRRLLTTTWVNALLDGRSITTNVHSAYISALCKQRPPFLHIEMDTKDDGILNRVVEMLLSCSLMPEEDYHTIETRAGYHFLIKHTSLGAAHAKLQAFVSSQELCTIVDSRCLVPLPGTLHYGFPVRMIGSYATLK